MIKSELLRQLIGDCVDDGEGDHTPRQLADLMTYSAMLEGYGPRVEEVEEATGPRQYTHDQAEAVLLGTGYPDYETAARTLYPGQEALLEAACFWDEVDAAEDELRESKAATIAEMLG